MKYRKEFNGNDALKDHINKNVGRIFERKNLWLGAVVNKFINLLNKTAYRYNSFN